jgi:hypothetical protein
MFNYHGESYEKDIDSGKPPRERRRYRSRPRLKHISLTLLSLSAVDYLLADVLNRGRESVKMCLYAGAEQKTSRWPVTSTSRSASTS